MHIATFSVLVGLAFFSSAHAGELRDNVNRFKNTRSVTWLAYEGRKQGFSLSTYAFYAKSDDKKPFGYFTMLSAPGGPQFSSCNNNDWLIDGVMAPEMKARYSATGQSETFTTDLKRETLEKLSHANKVEFSICGTEGVIPKEDLEGIAKVLNATK